MTKCTKEVIFNYYMKPKKIWRKVFKEDEVFTIFKAFMEATNVTLEDLKYASKAIKKISFKENKPNFPLIEIAKKRSIPTPESDCYDNLLGLSPNTVDEILKYSNLKNLKYILSLYTELEYIKDENGDVNWDKTFKKYLKEFKSVNKKKNTSKFHHYLKNVLFYKKEIEKIKKDEFFNSISFFQYKDIQELALVKPSKFRKLIAPEFKKLSRLRVEKFENQITTLIEESISIKEAKDEWMKVHNRVPKAELLLAIHPKNINFKAINLVKNKFGIAPINITNFKDALEYIKLFNLFGNNLISRIGTINEHFEDIKSMLYKFNIERVQRIDLSAVKKDIPYAILILILLMNRELSNKELNVINNSDTDFIYKFSKFLENTFFSNTIDNIRILVNNVSFFGLDFIKYIIKYVDSSRNIAYIINELKEIYVRRVKDKTLPTFKTEYNNYIAEILDVNSKEGLVTGYATDCCMVINGFGESCLHHGYKNSNSGFFVVKRKNQLLAQSWIWEFVENGKRHIVLDSVEILGRNLNQSKTVLKMYFELIKSLLTEHNYDYVIIGADGNTTPEGIDVFGPIYENISAIDLKLNKLREKYGIDYTDIKESVIFVKKEFLQEIEDEIHYLQGE